MSMMKIERFEELASAYGAAISLWPADEQAAAETFAATSPEAQAALTRERELDAMLNGWDVPAPSNALMARILGDAAEVSATASVAAPAPRAEPEKPNFLTRFFGDIGWRPAGAMAACLAIGMVAGLSGAPTPLDTTTDTELAQQASDADVLTAFFGEDDSDPFDLEIL